MLVLNTWNVLNEGKMIMFKKFSFFKNHNSNYNLNFFNHRLISYYNNIVLETKPIPGVICECGVGSGFSLFSLLASEYRISMSKNSQMRKFLAYDSFEGFPEPGEKDLSYMNVKSGKRNGRNWLNSKRSLLEQLKLAKLPIDSFELTTVKGFFEDTLKSSKNLPDQISLLHLDVDLYESYKICLEVLAARVSVGGIVMVDEYIDEEKKFPGAKAAINEFLALGDFELNRDSISGKYYMRKIN